MGFFPKNKNNGNNSEEDLESSEKKVELKSKEVENGLNDFQKKLLESAKLSDKERKKVLSSREEVEKFVNKILFSANKNIFEKNEILELAINDDSDFYKNHYKIKEIINNKLKKEFQKNKNLAFLILKNYIKNGDSIDEINFFIKEISGDNENRKEDLQNIFQEQLEKFGKITKINTQKSFFKITDENILSKILELKLVNKKGEINKNIFKIFGKELNENNKNIDDEQKIIEFLLNKLGLDIEVLKEKSVFDFLKSIANSFKIEKKIEEISPDDSGKKEEKNKEKKVVNASIYSINNDDFSNDSILLDFCYPGCILSEFGNNYEINLGENQKVEISKQDYNKFNEKSLENYINFLKILKLIKLDFLFENKYKSGFLQTLNNSFGGFDYKSGNGFDENHTLKTFTLIGNLIGIPKKYYKQDGELGTFDGIITAINIFSEINSTGIINDEKIGNPSNFVGPTIVEKKMLKLGILGENGGFSEVRAKEVLGSGNNKELT